MTRTKTQDMNTENSAGTVYDFTVPDASGSDICLDRYQGKVLLIVNVAGKCGFTPQYAGLQQLYETFRKRGFVILGFPCNQFGGQEPGADAEIQQFCSLNYGVSFPVLAKLEVNGEHAHPLFRFLKHAAPGILGTEAIKWNFTKFLVDRRGRPRKRFSPATKPEKLVPAIRALLDTAAE